MAPSLEHRRQAIAAALRAVMAEPLPQAQPDRIQPSPMIYAPLSVATVSTYSDSPSIRDALTAGIDWDDAEPQSDTPHASDHADHVVQGENLEGWESPSVPPLDTAGSMSRVASMALFGHA